MKVPPDCSVNLKCSLCSKTFCQKCNCYCDQRSICSPCGDRLRRPLNYVKPNVLFYRLAEHGTNDFTLKELAKIHECNILKTTPRSILSVYSDNCFKREIERLDRLFGDLSKIRRVKKNFCAKKNY